MSMHITLDGETIEVAAGETIWEAARRHGLTLPHLCHKPAEKPGSCAGDGYRPDGNCRACVVEVEGERALTSSCNRQVRDGMVVHTQSPRAAAARRMVFELLLADQPPRDRSPDANAPFWQWAERLGLEKSRFPARRTGERGRDHSHPAFNANWDACIHCDLCRRACREIQVNDVIAMAGRGRDVHIAFDMDDPLAVSSCVACGECVQACPTGALLPGDNVSRPDGERDVASVCPYCGVGCQISYRVGNNEILRVDGRPGPANRSRLCIKGRFGFDYAHHPDRLTVPLIRREGVAKGDPDGFDPAEPLSHFREASWEEALDAAASGLKKIRDEHGGQALAGFGSAKGTNEEAYLFQKLVRTGFGTNNVDHCTRLCHASSVAALMETIGSGAVTAPFTDAEKADVIIVTGANPTSNHPVAATYFKQAAMRGAKLIVMDPRGLELAPHAFHMIRHRPGSDVALLNAIMHVIVSENLQDQAYIDRFTEGFEALRTHLADYPPEAMETLTGIDAATIRELARTIALADKVMIFWGMGISQHVHGTDNARCLISLALMTGNVGRPGTGLHPLRGQNNVQGASDAGLIPMVYPDYRPVGDADNRKRMEAFWNAKLDPDPGLTVVEIMDAAHEGRIKGLYIMGENPAMSDPNLNHSRAALARLEHLVVQDIFLTETAAFADVILPASAWPEKTGSVTNSNRQVQMGRQAIEPPGDARQDLWIVQEIARRLGLDWHYDGPAAVFEEMRAVMPSIRGISWQRLEKEDAVTYPCPDETSPGQAVMFADGFPTPGGRGRFVPAAIVPPDEREDDEYPFILTTGRLLEHWHTGAMTRRAAVLETLEPDPVAFLCPADLQDMGLEPGDWLHLQSRRGAVTARARIDSGLPKGVVFLPFCYREAAANLLTNDALDPYGKIAEVKYCAIRLQPAQMPVS